MRSLVVLLVLFVSLIVPAQIRSQVPYDGNNNLPPFGSFSGSDFDIVSLQNGNLHIHIPLASWKQRSGKTVSMAFWYDTPAWTRQTTSQVVGNTTYYVTSSAQTNTYWHFVSPLAGGFVHKPANTVFTCTISGSQLIDNVYQGYTFVDSEGTAHPLDIVTRTLNCPNAGPPQLLQSPTMDGTGTMVSVVSGNYQVTLKDGTTLNGPIEDTNGNLINTADTLDRPLVTTTTGTNSTTYTIYDSNGSPQNYIVAYTSMSIATDFCTGDPHLNHPPQYTCVESGGNLSVPSSLTLPDGSAYAFTWYQGTSGELESVTLPTGATINYIYGAQFCTHGPLGYYNSTTIPWDCKAPVSSRQVVVNGVSSTWTYSGGTVTDPLNNTEVHSFSGVAATQGTCQASPGTFETQVQYSDSSGNLLKTVGTGYAAECDPHSQPTAQAVNVRPTSVTTTLNNGQVSQVQTDFETFTVSPGIPGTRLNPIEKREYDYGSGAPGALLRRTDYAYLHNNNPTYATLNIVDRPTQITTYNGAGTMMSQITYEYDVYNHQSIGLPSFASSGAVQHDSARGTSYTTRGNVTAITKWLNTNSSSITTYNQYDDAGNVIASRDANGNVTNLSYADSWANSTCAPTSGPAVAFPTAQTNPLGQATKFAYNSCTGSLASSKNQNDINAGRAGTTYSYDLIGRTTQVNFPDGGQTINCYSDVGGSTCSKSGPPFQTVVTRLATPSPSTTTTTLYDGLGRQVQTQHNSDPDGIVYETTVYDVLGRASQVYNPTRCTSLTTNCGEPTWGYTSYIYDALNRVCVVVPPDGTMPSGGGCPTTWQRNTVTTIYSGNSTTVTDQAGDDRKSVFDSLGRLTQVFENPAGYNYETDYTYDALDNLTRVDQWGGPHGNAGDRVRTFAYDSLSRLISATNPESSTITYSYDANSNLINKTSPAPNQTGSATTIISYCYDALNRMATKAYTSQTCPMSSPAASFAYDASSAGGLSLANTVGRMVAATTTGTYPTGTYYSYDPMGRITILAQCAYINNCGTSSPGLWGITSAYNLAGVLTSYTDGSGDVLTQTIDGAGRPTTLSSSWSDSTHPPILLEADATQGFAPTGALVKAGLGNGLSEGFAYNSRLQPCRAGLAKVPFLYATCDQAINGQNIQDYWLTYFSGYNNGSLTNWVGSGQQNFNRQYDYDLLNRLDEIDDTNVSQACQSLLWNIDAWGNMTDQTINGGTCPAFHQAVNAKNQFISGSYDAAGNLLGDGVHGYAYDSENRIQYVDSGSTGLYVYNAFGQRVAKAAPSGTTYYIYAPDGNVVAERNPQNGWIQTYIYFGGKLVGLYNGSDTRFIFSDHLGSARIVTLSNGSIYDSLDYLPFGQQTAGASGTTHKFTSKERDSESGLDDFDARYYSSSMGRFMSPDWSESPGAVPYGVLSNPQTLNLYAYVKNNPLKDTDPTGHGDDDDVVDHILNFAVSAGVTWVSDNLFGLGRPQPQTVEGTLGQAVGDLAAVHSGLAEDAYATTLTPGALVLAGAGQEEALLVPAGLAAHGTATALIGTANLAKDAGQTSSGSSDSGTGGGRNEQKSNRDRQQSAQDKLNATKAERDQLNSKPNKTPEDKAKLEKLNNQVKHLQRKAAEKSETHSRKEKGQQQ